jgi:hypothetical protein
MIGEYQQNPHADRITEILQRRAGSQTPQINQEEYNSMGIASIADVSQGPMDFLNAVNNVRDRRFQEQETGFQRELQSEQSAYKMFEDQLAAKNQQAETFLKTINMFTGGDIEGNRLLVEELDADQEDINVDDPYQLMTKIAGTIKKTGYQSPEQIKKKQLEGINKAILGKLGGTPSAPISVRNNNPGNLRPVGSDSGFQAFSSPQDGINAMRADLNAKIMGTSGAMKANFGEGYLPTLANVISTWAPPSENDTQNYINFVSRKTGLDPNQPLETTDIDKLIPAMIEMEGGQQASQYYQPVRTADSGQIMNDGMDENTQLQVMAALAKGDQAGALKAMADAKTNAQKLNADRLKNEADTKKGSFDTEQGLRKEFEALPDVKQFRDVEGAYKRITKSQDTGAGDISLIFNFMKMLDPGSTVREGEFATAENAAGIPTRIMAQYNNAISGTRLQPETRAEFLSQATQQYLGAEELFNERAMQYMNLAKEYGIDTRKIVSGARQKVNQNAKPPIATPAGGNMDGWVIEEVD